MKKKILVVEDDKFMVNAYRVKLEHEGYAVIVATNGEEAINLVTKERPDAILLDLIMPKKDGFAVLEEIKTNPQTKNIRVIVASNLGQEADRQRAMQLGADGYIVKTDISLAEIIKMVA